LLWSDVQTAKLTAHFSDELIHLTPGISEQPDPELRASARLPMIGHVIRR
jgi:hypothetical protein